MSLPQTTAYAITTTVDMDFDTAVTRVREELAKRDSASSPRSTSRRRWSRSSVSRVSPT